jgi:hypothetical protein
LLAVAVAARAQVAAVVLVEQDAQLQPQAVVDHLNLQ